MKPNPKEKILYLVIAGLIFFAWDSFHKRKQLERSLKVITKDFQKEREGNKDKFDSIQKLIHWQDETISDLQFDIEELDRTKADINKRYKDEKDRINTFSADSLERYFTRRYNR